MDVSGKFIVCVITKMWMDESRISVYIFLVRKFKYYCFYIGQSYFYRFGRKNVEENCKYYKTLIMWIFFFCNMLDFNFLNVTVHCLGNVLYTDVNCYYVMPISGNISSWKRKKISQSIEFFAVFTNVADLRFLPMLHIWTDGSISCYVKMLSYTHDLIPDICWQHLSNLELQTY